ncbi:MAG: class I SAM-dependent methyltransferase [Candidatus Edwardsbacteria bacterium]|nr:class I SAM-dependent methyltransferase [Candidatus Edwardsbacteria bacterium]
MKYGTDYAGHERGYVRKKQNGFSSWNTAEQLATIKADMKELCAANDFPKSGKLLELGCGSGDIALLFAQNGYHACGIDIAPTAIDWAKDKANALGLTAQFEVGQVTDLTRYSADSFDIVIDGHCLHCIIGDDRAIVLGEVYRILRPGGVFFVNTMCGVPRDPQILQRYDRETRCTVYGSIADRYIGQPKDILRELETAGFQVIRYNVRENNTPGDMVDDLLALVVK